MSTTQSATSPPIAPTQPASATAPGPPTGRRSMFRPGRILALAVIVGLVAVGFVPVMSWIEYRRNHSITDDVFVEAHIVNVAPQVVSGRLLRYLVDENDQVVQGQVVAELDPIPYRDKVNIAQARWNRPRPSWPASVPTSTGSANRCRLRSRSHDARSPRQCQTGPKPRNR